MKIGHFLWLADSLTGAVFLCKVESPGSVTSFKMTNNVNRKTDMAKGFPGRRKDRLARCLSCCTGKGTGFRQECKNEITRKVLQNHWMAACFEPFGKYP